MLGKVLIPLAIAGATILYGVRNVFDNNDAAVMRDFEALYDKSPKLAARYVGSIRRTKVRESLYHFMIWDTLERTIADNPCRLRNHDDAAWHLIGDVAWELSRSEDQINPFAHFWQVDLRQHSSERRWPSLCLDLRAMFDWVEHTYELGPVKSSRGACPAPAAPLVCSSNDKTPSAASSARADPAGAAAP